MVQYNSFPYTPNNLDNIYNNSWPYYGSYPTAEGFTVYPDYGGPPEPIMIGQQNQQQSMNPFQMYNQYKNYNNLFGGTTAGIGEGSYMGIPSDPSTYNIDWGGGSANSWWSGLGDWFSSLSSGSGGSSGLAGTLGYIAAAIAGQEAATRATDRTIEGQPTGNWFSTADGNWRPAVATEPWLAWLHSKWGWEPTAGERFDAAARNADWSNALKRLPAAADYYADPIRNWLGYETFSNLWGPTAGWMADPVGGLVRKIEDWF